MKQLSKREIAQLKRTAQNVAPLVTKKYKILEKAEMLKKEYDSIEAQISAWETATKEMTGGYTSEQLIKRVVENNVTKYVLRYPDTIYPPQETSNTIEECLCEGECTCGSDLDIDTTDNTI